MTETKGRPTPKRADQRAARKKPLVASTARRSGSKAEAKSRRAEAAATRARMRTALRTGDEANYPPIAAGPERAVVRDTVDGRRSFGWLAIPGWILGASLTIVQTPVTQIAGSMVVPLVIGIVAADGLLTARAVRRALDARWPDGTQARRRSLVMYGIARNIQFRRQRLPKPRVAPGGAPL